MPIGLRHELYEHPAAPVIRVDHSHLTVQLAPGAGQRLTLTTRRYANQPTLAFP